MGEGHFQNFDRALASSLRAKFALPAAERSPVLPYSTVALPGDTPDAGAKRRPAGGSGNVALLISVGAQLLYLAAHPAGRSALALGKLTHKRMAARVARRVAWVGVASPNRDSGTLRGHVVACGEGGRRPSGTVYGRCGRRTPQPGRKEILRAPFGGWQTEEGGLGGLHAQATLDRHGRHPQTPHSLGASSLPFPLTSKTVAFSCPIHPSWWKVRRRAKIWNPCRLYDLRFML